MKLWLHKIAHKLGINKVYRYHYKKDVNNEWHKVCHYCGKIEKEKSR